MKKIVYKEIYKTLKKLEKKVRADECHLNEMVKIKKLTKILVILSNNSTPFEVTVLRLINNNQTVNRIQLSNLKKIKNYFFVLIYLDLFIKNPVLNRLFYRFIPQLKKFDSFMEYLIKNDTNNIQEDLANLDFHNS